MKEVIINNWGYRKNINGIEYRIIPHDWMERPPHC